MNLLFMCVANSARSQLAEGLAKHLFREAAQIESAGSRPSKVNPLAVKVLSEIGIDISNHHSKSVDDLPKNFTAKIDYVITLCAEEVCPLIISQAKRLHWPFADPAGKGETDAERLQAFREARDGIHQKLKIFKESLNLTH